MYMTASKLLKAHAIRKESFLKVFMAWPNFYIQAKMKFVRDYNRFIFHPLIKQKNMDIVDQTFRSDFN